MKLRSLSSLATQSQSLSLSSARLRPLVLPFASPSRGRTPPSQNAAQNASTRRLFSSTPINAGNWLLPTMPEKKRSRKGRPRVPTGGSSRGTTVVWGDYGLRMCDHHRRVSAAQLKTGEEAIKVRLKGMRYRLYTRVCASIGVYSSGNEVRMGKGKGSFDHWASRIAVNKVIFEVKGDLHEKVVREAFRLAGNKMPGQYEFVKKGDPAVVGITKLDGITMEELKRPRRAIPLDVMPISSTAETMPTSASTSMAPQA